LRTAVDTESAVKLRLAPNIAHAFHCFWVDKPTFKKLEVCEKGRMPILGIDGRIGRCPDRFIVEE
jgi:hypothetical protein